MCGSELETPKPSTSTTVSSALCTARRAAETASRAGVAKLVLTHIPPWTDPNDSFAEARPEFAGDLELAVPGLAITL